MKRTDFFGDSRPVLPTDPKKDVRLSCRVEEATRVRLMSVAKRHRRRPSLLIRHAVERFLDLVEAQDAASPPKGGLAENEKRLRNRANGPAT